MMDFDNLDIETIKKNLRGNPILRHLIDDKLTDRQKIIVTFLDCAHNGTPPYRDFTLYELSQCLGMSVNVIKNELIHLIQMGRFMEHWVVLK